MYIFLHPPVSPSSPVVKQNGGSSGKIANGRLNGGNVGSNNIGSSIPVGIKFLRLFGQLKNGPEQVWLNRMKGNVYSLANGRLNVGNVRSNNIGSSIPVGIKFLLLFGNLKKMAPSSFRLMKRKEMSMLCAKGDEARRD